ncbi:MAG: hypothetical protein H6582_00955 [Crocinitomicaceae bacterium]|nr:hypothetical protein [Crocinitomicaceae bacterium]
MKQKGFDLISYSNGGQVAVKEIDGFQYKCNFGIGKFWITKNVFDGTEGSFWVRHHQTEELWEDLKPKVTNRNHFAPLEPTFGVQLNIGWHEFDYSISGADDYLNFFEISIDPVFEKAKALSSVESLDREINSQVELKDNFNGYKINTEGLIFRRLVLAKLNDNPLYDKICEHTKSFFPEYIAASKQYPFLANIPTAYEVLCDRLEKLNLTQ